MATTPCFASTLRSAIDCCCGAFACSAAAKGRISAAFSSKPSSAQGLGFDQNLIEAGHQLR